MTVRPAALRSRQPAVVIASRPGLLARLQLRSPVFHRLRENGGTMVVLWPESARRQLQCEMAQSGVFIEPLVRRADTASPAGLVERWLRRARMYVSPAGCPSGGQADRLKLAARAVRTTHQRLWWKSIELGVGALNRHAGLRRAAMRLEARAGRTSFYRSVFDRFEPGVVVLGTPGYSAWPEDGYLIREAARAGIPTVCILPSWDHPTAKGMFGAQPDHFLVWAEQQREHLAAIHGVSRSRVAVTGSPIFDMYAANRRLDRRTELQKQLGLDPARKTILFAMNSPRVYSQNVEIAEILVNALLDGRITVPAQLILRPHPVTLVDRSHPDLARLAALAARAPHVHVNLPDVVAADAFDLPWHGMEEVARLVCGSDVIVNLFSTVQLEAAVADTPVISVAFDPRPPGRTERSLVRISDYDYHARLRQTGAIARSDSPQELIEHLNAYLVDAGQDRAGRAALVAQECGPIDGRASERIADFILAVARRGDAGAGMPAELAVGA